MIFAAGPAATAAVLEATRLPDEEQPDIVTMVVGGEMFLKTYLVKNAGTALPQHSHRYDHLTQICTGAVRVFLDGDLKREMHAGDAMVIPAGTKHLFVTTENWTRISCIHHDRTGEGAVDILEEHQIT